MNAVKKAAIKIINDQLACRIQPNAIPPMNDVQINCVAQTTASLIDYAAALDLDRRPRLSRTNAGKFKM